MVLAVSPSTWPRIITWNSGKRMMRKFIGVLRYMYLMRKESLQGRTENIAEASAEYVLTAFF